MCFSLLRHTNKDLFSSHPGSFLSNLVLKGCGSFPGSNILMVECLPEVEAQPQPLLWCPSGVLCFTQIFTLTSRSLHLPVGGQLISSISFEMFGCSLSFSNNLELGSPSSGLSHSTFLISSSALLYRRMLFFVIILDKDILEIIIRFISFPGFPDYQDATYQLIIFSIGQWTTSLPQFASLLWLLWFTLAHSFAFGQGVPLCGNALWPSH